MFGLGKFALIVLSLPLLMVFLVGAAIGAALCRR